MTDHAQAAVDMLAAVTEHRASLAAEGSMEPNRYKGHVDAIELDLKSAHVLAMLAVAEQTRIANLIAYSADQMGSLEIDVQIREGLGL